MITEEAYAAHQADWNDRMANAEDMVPLVGRLNRERGIETSVSGRMLVNRGVIDIIKAHRFARQIEGEELSVFETLPVLRIVEKMSLAPCHVDLGKLVTRHKKLFSNKPLEDFVHDELAGAKIPQGQSVEGDGTDIVLYGFGRIGRLLAREMLAQRPRGASLRLRAIVVRRGGENDLIKRASLLRRDSVHGSFKGTITVDHDNSVIHANGTAIQVIYASSPDAVDYTLYGISNAVVVDNTGMWRDRDGLSQHLRCPGAAKVVLTAPGKGDIKNIVMGVNDDDIAENDSILSAASCTTNAITPVLKALDDKYGVITGHVETVHAYTNDQNLIDNYHKGDRRGRAAPLNMVLTETGAAQAVSKALPHFEGRLTGNAIRVPTANVSMAILNLQLQHGVTADELNDYLRHIALHSSLQKQVDFTNSPEAVSSDFVGSRAAGIVDSLSTQANAKSAVVYVWYDNEAGYSCQVIRMMRRMVKATLPAYPIEG
ncbi:glyceraldehyde-3-phosphate dehydrogenase [Litorivicinus lipolyticus]|uniref:Glyceraldehyde-3-phosphate dehydrogenase n=1 Tax=Litorivicinus lipolyticus TaxID=418701 RepID=A0A5Q2Q6M9_9GAMM|nr:glyceraldehyde-3-phosphate dehydrogenase [Litorivicinus lipolyticus]QGG79939.1 glyceraldehyde-3-phosphate dehydrogenase [Litorivicinus lipolyticus]